MKNIFITGGLGQDGQILTKILLSKKKYRIYVLGKKKNVLVKKGINLKKSNLLNKKN